MNDQNIIELYQEAFIGLISATLIEADNLTSDELINLVKKFKWTRDLKPSEITNFLNITISKINDLGFNDLIEIYINILPDYYHESIFAIILDIILSDGEITNREEDFIHIVENNMIFTDNLPNEIFKIISLKNLLI